MSLQIIETGEVIEPMSKVEAERITARIADKLDGIADNLEQVLDLIGQALTRQAWKPLGYASPTAYVSERFSGALQRLPIETRRSVVGELSAAGMSTRAIAPIVGVGNKTVARDIAATVSPDTVDPDRKVISLDGRQRPATQPKPEPADLDEWRGEVLHQAEEDGEIVRITGPDSVADPGEAFPEQEPARPRRTPLTDSIFNAVYDLCRRVESVRKLCDDDRFPQNAEKVAQKHLNDLLQCRDLLQQVIDQLNPER